MAHYLPVRGFSRRGFRVDQDSRVNYATAAVIDLDDQTQMRILKGHRNDFFTSSPFIFPIHKAGGAATGAFGQVVVPRAMKIKEVVATLGTGPVGSTFIVDIHKVDVGGEVTDAGTTIFTTTSRRPTIGAGVTAVNEIQTLAKTGTVSSGQFKVQFGLQTTADLAYDITAAAFQTALEGLSNVGAGNVLIGDAGADNALPYTITFQGTLAGTDVALMTVQPGTTPLAGGGSYAITLTTAGVAGLGAGSISTVDATNGVPEVTSVAAGDILRAEVDQVGSSTAGSNLIVYIKADLV